MARPVDYAALTEKRCSGCGETKPVAEFNRYSDPKAVLTGWRYYSRCRPCAAADCRTYGAENKPQRNARLRRWRRQNPDAASAKDRRARLQKRYRLTEAAVGKLRAVHDGMCWLCLTRSAVVIEHSHDTGAVRGMACHGCNSAVLSRVDADPDFLRRVADYVSDQPCHADVLLEIANGGAC